ncbi:unnamed protein product [marine sediment metagenome]|uniref:UDP-2,4-diacetamido-2,4, 6-trideoxy-beta-L-altropyranose hydrolase n=1 Tax=marine sediment metagenome TaxID=412755 RepID=X1HWG1_9ZZZZ
MKVLILTEGGEKIGFGHITRCIALYEALREESIDTELVINGDRGIFDLLRHKNFSRFDWIKNKERLFKILTHSDFIPPVRIYI